MLTNFDPQCPNIYTHPCDMLYVFFFFEFYVIRWQKRDTFSAFFQHCDLQYFHPIVAGIYL